jgi:hypothetical protein
VDARSRLPSEPGAVRRQEPGLRLAQARLVVLEEVSKVLVRHTHATFTSE